LIPEEIPVVDPSVNQSLAVVVINHFTTVISGAGADAKSELQPALGISWEHQCATRVACYFDRGERYAKLLKGQVQYTHTDPSRCVLIPLVNTGCSS